MTKNNKLADQELDDLFAQEAARVQDVPPALLQRVMDDADLVIEANKSSGLMAVPVRSDGIVRSLFSAIGGWPGIGGLATATVVGIWIGFSPPATIDGLADSYLADNSSYDFGDFMPTIDDFLSEG